MPVWTNSQSEAINASSGGESILVSAAAGSGKTAVLVERIITMILNGTDIDRLLVVTFTEAAAAEMKEKIISRIQRALDEAEDKQAAARLKRQLRLAGSADIETIDAFCLRTVKNNFHALGIDPNFMIADPAEGSIISDETLDDLFSDLYARNDEAFLRLIDMYASNRSDEELKSLVKMIYNFTRTFAEPFEWLDEKAEMYSEKMSESRWEKELVTERCCRDVGAAYRKKFAGVAAEMIKICSGTAPKSEDVENILRSDKDAEKYWAELWTGINLCFNAAKELENVKNRDEACEFYKKYIEPKNGMDNLTRALKSKTKLASDEDWDRILLKRNDIKNKFRKACTVNMSSAEMDANLDGKAMKRTLCDLIRLVKEFHECFEAKKDSRGVKEFSDIEHLTHKLFKENENIRDEYRNRYDEILIDEYQDTNGLQDAIFESISRDKKNIFMVGDLKQSIYAFRGGDPDIFKSKSRAFAEGGGKKIVLSQNFRSRKEILESVNDLFSSIMSDRIGDVVYEGDELIVRDEERECYPPCPSYMDRATEMHAISLISGEEQEENDYIEASYIADRINELINGGYLIFDKETGRYRKITYKDITILSRSTRFSADTYMRVLSDKGIPAFVEVENYFERREISLMLSLISAIMNHLRDVPLIAVARSPIGGFTDNELALVRIYCGDNREFYKAMRLYAQSGSDGAIRGKCAKLTESLARWREYTKRKSAANLIWTLYEETGIYDFMGALEGGFEAQANLKLLYERARQYEAAGFRGLFNFIKYIERMRDRSSDINGAKLIGENHDVVRIMTIHKSKGLEFPVVFLAGTGKRFVFKSADSRILLHKELGFGMTYVNAEKSFYRDTVMRNIVQRACADENISETMRILYVALTRAREKLIVTSVSRYKSDEQRREQFDKWRSLPDLYGVISPDDAAGAASFSDWLIPAAMTHPLTWRLVTVNSYTGEETEAAENTSENSEPSRELVETVGKILDYKYTYPESGGIPSKTSVSAIKTMAEYGGDELFEARRSEFDRSDMAKVPEFMEKQTAANEIGTMYHDVMAYVDFSKIRKADDIRAVIHEEVERLIDEKRLDPETVCGEYGPQAEEKVKSGVRADFVSKMEEDIADLFKSDFGRRMTAADKIYRERSFQINIPANVYDDTLGDQYSEETVILQGIIDCFFEEDGEIVLLDYKTDKCTADTVQKIADKYRVQLELYADAIKKITKKSVKKKYLYLFSVKSVVELD